jgi:hypothetical protein
MRSLRSACAQRRLLRQLSKELSTVDGFGEPPKPPPHRAKDFLGAAVTLAIIGVILLQVTNGLASRCGARLNPRRGPGACSGVAAVAEHAHGAVTLGVAACAGLAAIAFTWYMLWGYKTGGQRIASQDTSP